MLSTPKCTPMLTKDLKQCKICNQWFHTGSGGYTKHIRNCQHQSCLKSLSDNKCLMSLNPLLSLTTNNQSPNNDYNCDLYDDQSYSKSNLCIPEDYHLVDDDFHLLIEIGVLDIDRRLNE